MKRHWIEFTAAWVECPMTYWVHIGPNGEHWHDTDQHDPPAPRPVAGKGFPVMYVEVDGFTFVFSSLAELDVCVETLAKKALPTSTQLAAKRGSGAGPNSHWLSRLPGKVKSWKYRSKALTYLKKARADFVLEMGAR